MRVLHVYKTYYPDTFGGIEQVIRQIALSTMPLGVESRVFTLSTNARQQRVVHDSGLKVIRAPVTVEIASNAMSLQAIHSFRQAVEWADVLQYHFPWPFGDVLHLLAGKNKPALVTYHSDIVRQKALMHVYRPLMTRFLSSIQAIVATSPNYAQSSDTLQRLKDRVSMIPIGIDETSFPPPDSVLLDSWRERVGEGFFLFIGVLRYYKGLHILLEAMRDADLPLVIVGKGPEEGELQALARTLKLRRVVFAGAVPDDDKMALLALSQAVVFPSHLRSEAYGVTLVEAAMCGKPMITAEIGTGTSFVNLNNETGLVVPPADSAALLKAMTQLEADPERTAEMGFNARRRFEALFTADRMGRDYDALYRRLRKEMAKAA
ncbi:glycosyltransferase family 4 protein [Cupriavidus necator]|uniref:Glycosyltransferase n=1 Tax=Cupriavidus necator TaxID=106590 RepID=A0A367PFW6_CUPNE|nr:glycosyltransferase family 4 protein [Cupriavidus necator]RCJ06781.1 glycosyltransferase [Cupriavidus necator]